MTDHYFKNIGFNLVLASIRGYVIAYEYGLFRDGVNSNYYFHRELNSGFNFQCMRSSLFTALKHANDNLSPASAFSCITCSAKKQLNNIKKKKDGICRQ